ncbi:MAG: hypothetical protein P8I79_07900 [Amylibacter sp.]|nr:hypothetical protein [Amylibacter sp.]
MLWDLFSGPLIYVPILTICVLFGMYVGSWVAKKQGEIGGKTCVIIGGAVGWVFLFPIVCGIGN